MSTPTRIALLVDVTHKLGTLIANETELLRRRRPRELAVLQPEKERLSKIYDNEMRTLRENPGLAAASPPREMELLRSVIKWFAKVLEDHHRALMVAKTVTERLVKAVSDEVSARSGVVSGYSKYATTATTTMSKARPVSLAVNQVI